MYLMNNCTLAEIIPLLSATPHWPLPEITVCILPLTSSNALVRERLLTEIVTLMKEIKWSERSQAD